MVVFQQPWVAAPFLSAWKCWQDHPSRLTWPHPVPEQAFDLPESLGLDLCLAALCLWKQCLPRFLLSGCPQMFVTVQGY